MNNLKKYADGIARTGLLGAGLVGMYLSHKERIPQYMGLLCACYISCIGLYALTTFLLQSEREDSESKDKDSPKPETHMAETPTSEKKSVAVRGICTGFSSKVTSKVLENSPLLEESKLSKTQPKNFPNVDNINHSARENMLKLEELKETKQDTTEISLLRLALQNPAPNVDNIHRWLYEIPLEHEIPLEWEIPLDD